MEEWEGIQRIMVSLALKTTTQSIIVGKLGAYTRKNKTRRALWEYDNIIKSLYLIDYIDSPPLRRNVQRALNRGESYHQLRRAVAYANFGKLRFKTAYEQQIWEECSRLITNCIIFYNATILSGLLNHMNSAGNIENPAGITAADPGHHLAGQREAEVRVLEPLAGLLGHHSVQQRLKVSETRIEPRQRRMTVHIDHRHRCRGHVGLFAGNHFVKDYPEAV